MISQMSCRPGNFKSEVDRHWLPLKKSCHLVVDFHVYKEFDYSSGKKCWDQEVKWLNSSDLCVMIVTFSVDLTKKEKKRKIK